MISKIKYEHLSLESPRESEEDRSDKPFSAFRCIQPLIIALSTSISHFSASINSLKTCPKELYINFVLKFCESYNYFAMSQVLVIYLHEEFGFSDIQAGACYGMWGASITFWGLLTSWINDNLGVRLSLLVGFTISFFATLLIASTTSTIVLLITLFAILPLGTSMGIPMLTVGIRRYTNSSNRGFAFGLYYSVMNIAAFVSGPVVDILNIGLKDGIVISNTKWSGNRLVILTASSVCICSVILTYTSLREVRVKDDSIDETHTTNNREFPVADISTHQQLDNLIPDTDKHTSDSHLHLAPCDINPSPSFSSVSSVNPAEQDIENPLFRLENTTNPLKSDEPHHQTNSLLTLEQPQEDLPEESPTADDTTKNDTTTTTEEYIPKHKSLCSTISEIAFTSKFLRFSLFTLFMINLKTVFRHLDATLPTYLIRIFGPNVSKGTIYSINPFIIMLLTPIVAAFTSSFAHYDMIKFGGFITAISPFCLVVSTSIPAAICMVVLLSLGEAIWSPRTYDYTMSIAPEGREASFAALAAAPLFAAKVPVGLMSGYLLSTYVPEDGNKDNAYMLWLIVGLMTLSSPILIAVLEKYIREKGN